MAAKDLIIDPSEYDLDSVISDIEVIRSYNPQRFEMEHLSGILYENQEKNICVGYKDITEDEFWIRGHMPNFPLMPGVIMCEAAAQIASYYTVKFDVLGLSKDQFLGFGGMENVRFRGIVRPGDKLVIATELVKLRKHAMCVCRFQCIVGENIVCSGQIKGIPISLDM